MTEPWGAQGFNIGDELLGGGMLVKDLTAVFELCKAVWPEGITCQCCAFAFPDSTHKTFPTQMTELAVQITTRSGSL